VTEGGSTIGRVMRTSTAFLPRKSFFVIILAKYTPNIRENIVAIDAILRERSMGLSIISSPYLKII